jgi:hypothetical protein
MQPDNTQKLNRHKFNIFPPAKPEDFERLKQSIRDNGFDPELPVTVYQGGVLDGWNRYTACVELGVQPTFRTFEGTDEEALALVMKTNTRRNLSSGQWATIAVEAEEIVGRIRAAAEAREGGRPKKGEQKPGPKLVQVSEVGKKSAYQIGAAFNTSRTYVNDAARIQKAAPEVFQKVKAGKMSMQDATRIVRAIPTEPWLDDERERQQAVESGEAVLANASRDKNLIQWAAGKGLEVRIDRGTVFGNPYVLGEDGDRNEVCNAYGEHYLPHKRSALRQIGSLRGKVLVCHCFPERCHGLELLRLLEEME